MYLDQATAEKVTAVGLPMLTGRRATSRSPMVQDVSSEARGGTLKVPHPVPGRGKRLPAAKMENRNTKEKTAKDSHSGCNLF